MPFYGGKDAKTLVVNSPHDNTRQTGEVLAEYGGQLAEHLAAVIAAPLPPESRAENWLDNLLDLYARHSTHDQPENRAPAAALDLPFLRRFPEHYNNGRAHD